LFSLAPVTPCEFCERNSCVVSQTDSRFGKLPSMHRRCRGCKSHGPSFASFSHHSGEYLCRSNTAQFQASSPSSS
jgi:hypothetical protein